MKIVLNKCYGGFGLSHAAILEYAELKGITLYHRKGEIGQFYHYTTVPYKKYERLHEIDKRKGNYSISNAVCFSERDIPRNDPILIQVVKKLGIKANGEHSRLEIIEIPDGIEYEIEEYDGMEHIAEKHRTWG